jgi:hypothetical protein
MEELMRDFKINDLVIARFTNSHRQFEFIGKVVGKTKNYWKVQAIISPYPQEQPGRVFQIATSASRIYSVNNCIAGFAAKEIQ